MSATLKKFMALYLIPVAVMDEWIATDPAKRKAAEDEMKGEWHKWTAANAKAIIDTNACGKTKSVTSDGVSDTRNDITLYSIVEAESQEAAAKLFVNHPHLQIPRSSIEIMELRSLGGM